MDKWSFGLTMMIVAGGGTFVALWLIGLVIDLLKRIWPLEAEGAGDD